MEKVKTLTVTLDIESADGDAVTTVKEVLEVPAVMVEGPLGGVAEPVHKSYPKATIAAMAQDAMDKLKSKFLQGLTCILAALLIFSHLALADTVLEETQIFRDATYKSGISLKTATVSLNCSTAAGTCTATNLIPAGSTVLGVAIRVTTLFAGCTTFQVGDGTDADRWGNAIAVAAGTTTTGANFTAGGAISYPAATSVVLTAVGGGADFTAGVARIVVTYFSNEAPVQ